MEDDPWGSAAVDPWTASKQAVDEQDIANRDPLNVPKDFLVGRRPSANADPWGGAQESQGSVDDGIVADDTRLGSPSLPIPTNSWAPDREDDGGWGAPASIVGRDGSMDLPSFDDPQVEVTRVDSPEPFTRPADEGSSFARDEAEGIELATSSPAFAASRNSLDGFRSPSPAQEASAQETQSEYPAFKPFLADEDLDIPTFPTTSPQLPTFPTTVPESPSFGSPSFGDDAFGGFSGGMEDPAPMPAWEPAHKGDDDGWGSPNFGSPDLQVGATGGVAVDAWGAEREDESDMVPPPRARDEQEDEWDRARKAIERREAVAPTELVAKLEREWRQLARECYGSKGSSGQPGSAEDDEGLDQEMVNARDQLARELSSMPPEIDTFQHNLAMSMTWARYQDALSQINLDTRSSVLALVSRQSATRAARRGSLEWQKEFQSRNKVEDTQAQKDARANAQAEEARPKWSFWGKRQSTQTVPLVTSGGGILEVKALSPSNTGSASLHSGAKTPLPVTQEIGSPISVGTNPSIMSPVAVTTTSSLPGSVAPLATQGQADEPAPGAMGRWFGRFRKPRTSTPSVDVSNQDLELTKDDFSFLDQVPTAPPAAPKEPGIGDLLSMSGTGGRNEEMASLESMLSSKPVALPSRLAPPPMSNSRASSAASVPRLSGSNRSSSHIDMFGDLDLSSPSPPISTAKPSTSSNGLFELMASGSTTPQIAKPTAMPKDFDFFGTSAAAGPSKPSQPPAAMPKVSLPPAKPSAINDDDDDFGDFGQTFVSAPAQTNQNHASFDEFGDFGGFEDPASSKAATSMIAHPRAQTQPPAMDMSFFDTGATKASARPPDLNFGFADRHAHDAATNLVEKAAERQGRWPAPPSPVPDALSPPPGPNNAYFPRLDSPNSGQLNVSSLSPGGHPRPAPATYSPAMTPLVASTSLRDKRATLSAQDLSFFDSL